MQFLADMYTLAAEMGIIRQKIYHQTSNIRRIKYQILNVFHLVLQLSLPQSTEAGCWVENEDVVGSVPTGGAPTTSEWSTISLPKVQLILEVWGHVPWLLMSRIHALLGHQQSQYGILRNVF